MLAQEIVAALQDKWLDILWIIVAFLIGYVILQIGLRILARTPLGASVRRPLHNAGLAGLIALAIAGILQTLGLDIWRGAALVAFRIILILSIAWLAVRILEELTEHVVRMLEDAEPTVSEVERRAQTLATVVRTTGRVLIGLVALMMVLRELGLDIGPLLAGAGIVGLAISLGSQTLVRDMIAGFYILLEGQFDVGDVIAVRNVTGTVEKMTFRSTFLRDMDGTLHVVPNGEIRILSNRTKGWSRALISIRVPYDVDLDQAAAALHDAGRRLMDNPEVKDFLLESPTVTGVEDLSGSGMVFQIMVKVIPGKQWTVAQALRRHIKEVMDQAGIKIA